MSPMGSFLFFLSRRGFASPFCPFLFFSFFFVSFFPCFVAEFYRQPAHAGLVCIPVTEIASEGNLVYEHP